MIGMNILLGAMLTAPLLSPLVERPDEADTVVTVSPLGGTEGGLPLTISQAEQLLAERNPQLRMAWIEVDEARAALQQERLWENPEVSILYNVYNPLTRRYFDAGREGELDIEVEQPIPIGGQRRERIRKQQALLSAAEYRQQWTAFCLRMELHRTMTDLYTLQEKVSLYDSELASVARILSAYRRLADEGNASRMEVARIEALQLRLRSEQSEWEAQRAEREKELRLMLRVNEELRVKNEEFATAIPKDLEEGTAAANSSFFTLHSSLLNAKHSEALAAEHDLRLQRANALPSVSLKTEYDKNGNICRDFWGVGLSLSVPLFNRNQGNIRQSAAALERLRLEEQTVRREMEQEVALCLEQLRRSRQLLAECEQAQSAEWTLEGAERQFLARNLSLLELIDFYEAYREMRFLRLDAQHGVWQAAIRLNEKSGQEIIRIK